MANDLQMWPQGRLIAFSALDGPTYYPAGLVLRTVALPAGIEVVLPARATIRFADAPVGQAMCEGGAFEWDAGNDRSVRGVLLDAHHLLIAGDCAIDAVPEGLMTLETPGRLLIGATAAFDPSLIDADLNAAMRARGQWLASQSLPTRFAGSRANTVRAALSFMKGQVCSPEAAIKRRWTSPDRWPHCDMWLWDSAFHAIGWRHVDPALAKEMIDAVFDGQADDGFIPHQASPYKRTDMTQPPVLALGVKLVRDTSPDRAWVERLYPKLAAYIQWDFDHRDLDGGGLVEWRIDNDAHCRSGESGMDNSPRFDTDARLDAVDFNSYLASECETMAAFARELGRDDDAEKWAAHHRRLCALINDRLWSADEGFYFDRDVQKDELSPVVASAGFLPLLCGAATPEQAAALVRRLKDPDWFATALPVPSIAVRDTASYSKDLFRGPVWMNLNWLIHRGLVRYRFHDVAADLRDRSLAAIEDGIAKYGVFFEYYDDRAEVDPPQLLRKGRCAPQESPYHQAIHDFGWTATLYLDWVASMTKI